MIVIDAGTRPKPLAIAGAGEVTVLDSTSIMELDELPEHLIILGGGYIGLEFGQMFRRLGSEVTIIQKRRSPADDRGRGRLGRGRRDLAR